jgi:hypothetical protein
MPHDDPMFKIFYVGIKGGEAYADDPGGARAAYWTLHRDRSIMGTRVAIKNQILDRLVYIDPKRGQ